MILFASLYRTKEILIFYVHFFIELSIHVARQKWSSLSSIWKRLQAAKTERSPLFFRVFVTFPLQWPFLSSCWVAFGRPSYLRAVLPGMPRHWRFPPASGGHPPRLLPPSGEGYCLSPEAVPKRGMPTGPKVFLALPDACGLRLCNRTHLKNGLVPYSCVGGTHR